MRNGLLKNFIELLKSQFFLYHREDVNTLVRHIKYHFGAYVKNIKKALLLSNLLNCIFSFIENGLQQLRLFLLKLLISRNMVVLNSLLNIL